MDAHRPANIADRHPERRPYRAPTLTVFGSLPDVTKSVGKMSMNADGFPGVGMNKTM